MGISNDYKIQLASAFVYKAFVNVLNQMRLELPPGVATCGLNTWGCWPISTATQSYAANTATQPIGEPYIQAGGITPGLRQDDLHP